MKYLLPTRRLSGKTLFAVVWNADNNFFNFVHNQYVPMNEATFSEFVTLALEKHLGMFEITIPEAAKLTEYAGAIYEYTGAFPVADDVKHRLKGVFTQQPITPQTESGVGYTEVIP